MAAARGKTVEEVNDVVKDAPIVADLQTAVAGVQAGVDEAKDDENAPLSPDERQGALANLLGTAVVAPDPIVVKTNEAIEPVVAGDGKVSVTVVFDRYQHNPGTGWVNARAGDTIRVTEAEALRGIRLGGLKANA